MHVGVLGGGFQGCCIALSLAERGVRVTLFDRNQALITKAGAANEGKIHLGYMYAGDPTLRTARTMLTGALAFEPFLKRHLGAASPALQTSTAAAYVIHRDTQQPAEQVAHYLNQVHGLIADLAKGHPPTYFGMDLLSPPRRWSASEREASLNAELAVDVFQTAEVAINPRMVARAITECVANHPLIDVHLGCEILGVAEEPNSIVVCGRDTDGAVRERFDHAVNALWDGRLAINETAGMPTARAWIHRLKYGVSFRFPEGVRTPPSLTFILGPFGEVVSYGKGLTYLTWYPTCLRAISREVTPPDWSNFPEEPLRSEVLSNTLAAMAEIVPALRGLDPHSLPEATVKGGAIVAWGATDIYDPSSELHRRYEIGINSKGSFHSVDPGKLTMAPYFAEQCAARLTGSALSRER